MKLYKYLRSRFTMKFKTSLFYDYIAEKNVNLYIDCFGNEYMATSKFGFRILREEK